MSISVVAKVIQMAFHLDSIPNTAYFPIAMNRIIHRFLKELPEIQIAEDPFAIYAHYSHGSPRYKLLIDTHLDHPGFIVLQDGTAMPVGTIAEPGMVPSIRACQQTLPVFFYDRDGHQIGEGYLHDLVVSNGRTRMQAHLSYPANKKLPANTQAIPQVPSKREEDSLLMRSADNLSVTALALGYLHWLLTACISADVTLIFSKLEEVRQVSATAIARRGSTPFAPIDEQTQIVVLEAGLVGSTPRTQQVAHTPVLSYQGGTLIRVSDHEWPYQREGRANLAESLLLHAKDAVSKTQPVNIQHGPSIGNCNALSYAFFSRCPHVSALMIPCVNKHNFDQQGHLVSERIAIADMLSVQLLLEQATILGQGYISAHPEQILLSHRQFPGNSPAQIAQKQKSWKGACTWATPRLRGEYFTPTTPFERIQCRIASSISHFFDAFP